LDPLGPILTVWDDIETLLEVLRPHQMTTWILLGPCWVGLKTLESNWVQFGPSMRASDLVMAMATCSPKCGSESSTCSGEATGSSATC